MRDNKSQIVSNEIAIVGISCRFPDADNYSEFWNNLKLGKNSVREIPQARWDNNKYFSPNVYEENKSYCKWAGLLENIKLFDYQFFSISPREANEMDPHQRVLLEQTARCIEDSGIPLNELRQKKTSVFVGLTELDYYLEAAYPDTIIERYAATGSFPSISANRISYNFGFKGQSMALDTACASSLTAIHEGKKALLSGDCDFAVVGSACIISHPWKFISFSKGRALSPDGRCKTFDKDANGFVPGEGAGVIIMQRLEDALQSKNNIYGIVKGSAVNHGGKSVTLPAPQVKAQKSVLIDAYEDANVNPETISYIEAHGTGTSLGDPIEVEALTQAFRSYTNKKQFCKIGSVKTNIGHLGPAAGMASIAKVLLMLRHKKYVGSLNYEQPNPIIDFENSPFSVVTDYDDWKSDTTIRAGISSFGIGGANAHVVIESWPHEKELVKDTQKSRPFILSAKTEESLDKVLDKWRSYVSSPIFESENLVNICKTLESGRDDHPIRFGKLVKSKKHLKELISGSNDLNSSNTITSKKSWILCIDNLKITHTSSLAQEFENTTIFKQHFKNISNCLQEIDTKKYKEFSLKDLSSNSKLFTFIAGYIYCNTLFDLGIKPAVISSNGAGAILGPVVAGMLSVTNGLKVLLNVKGASNIRASRPEIGFYDIHSKQYINRYKFDKHYIESIIRNIKISKEEFSFYKKKANTLYEVQFTFKQYIGDWDKILARYKLKFIDLLNEEPSKNSEQNKKRTLLLLVVILNSIRQLHKKWNLKEENLIKDKGFQELIHLMTDEVLVKEHLVELLTLEQPDYSKIIGSLNERQTNINIENEYSFIENANNYLTEIPDIKKWISILNKKENSFAPDKNELCITLGKTFKINDYEIDYLTKTTEKLKEISLELWLRGGIIDWNKLDASDYYKCSLPTYEFDGKECWREKSKVRSTEQNDQSLAIGCIHPFIDTNESTLYEQKFTKRFTGSEFYFTDHIIDGKKIFPGAAFIEMSRAASEIAVTNSITKLSDIVFSLPLIYENDLPETHVSLYPENNKINFEVYSADNQLKTSSFCTGKIALNNSDTPVVNAETIDIESALKSFKEGDTGKKYYDEFERIGINYGQAFQTIQKIYFNNNEAVSHIVIPDKLIDSRNNFFLHPSVVDAAFQTVSIAHGGKIKYLPFSIGEIEIISPCNKECYVRVSISSKANQNSELIHSDIQIADKQGNVLIKIKDFYMKSVNLRKEEDLLYYSYEWRPNEIKETTPGKTTNKILVLDQSNRQNNVGEILNTIGAEVLYVAQGHEYKKLNEDGYVINQFDKEHVEKLIDELKESLIPENIIFLWPVMHSDIQIADISNQNTDSILPLFYLCKALMGQKTSQKFQISNVSLSNRSFFNPYFNAVAAFARTVRLEIPDISIKTIQIDPGASANGKQVGQTLLYELNSRDAFHEIYYDDKLNRWLKTLNGHVNKKTDATVLKRDGAYIVTGGVGGIGMIISNYLVEKYNARIVLTCRSELTPEIKNKVALLSKSGGKVEYIQADISSQGDTKKLINTVLANYSKINGIFHCAGITKDSLLINKTKDELESVFAAKVNGTINLDTATREIDLDFIALFSSITSVFGNVGQADYGYANGFMDAYASFRNSIIQKGKTISINWPLWRDGGMHVDSSVERRMYQQQGTTALTLENALKALEYTLNSGIDQAVVVQGNKDKINEYVDKLQRKESHKSSNDLKEIKKDSDSVKANALKYLKELLANETQLNPEEIQDGEDFENYGIDSVMIVDLTRVLEEKFGILPITLFFEYQNINDLADYLSEKFPEKLVDKVVDAADESVKEFAKNDPHSVPYSVAKKPRFIVESQAGKEDVNEIAIIGISGKFPLAKDVDEFWENLKQGKDCITEIPKSRWDNSRFFNPDKSAVGSIYTKWGGFLDDIDQFDPLFFNISPKEAELIDPQERLFLQTTYHALEDAGYTKTLLKDKPVGVYAGAMWSEYQLYGVEETLKGNVIAPTSQIASIANRVSYFFNFNGPSIGIDSMCSSSITAIYLACEELTKGTIEYAVAGGVNVSVHPSKYLFLSNAKFAASNGKCMSFGEGGDGYVPGEGVGAFILKPLGKAITDGDNIYGVIKGWSINHGGKTNGYTVPNPIAQSNLIRKTLKESAINPDSINYIEAHGTGTSLGDPIEISALTKAFEEHTDKKQFCAIGSVKSNIGHLESAAGAAGLIKALLQLKYKTLVPSIHSGNLNPNIDFSTTPFYVQKELKEWKPLNDNGDANSMLPRRVAISAFGAGGSNGHLILEEFSKEIIRSDAEQPGLFLLSANNEESLNNYAHSMHSYLQKQLNENGVDLSLQNICYTSQIGREEFPCRLAVVAENIEALLNKIEFFLTNKADVNGSFSNNLKKNKAKLNHELNIHDYVFSKLSIDQLTELADFWVHGNKITWSEMYKDQDFQRTSLPPYPFSTDSYWIPKSEKELSISRADSKNIEIHPLVHSNESTVYEQIFTTEFDGKEFFLNDHRVDGHKILPGVAFIEMALVASKASGLDQELQVKDITWKSPLIVSDKPKNVYTKITPFENYFGFEIFTKAEPKITYCTGNIILQNNDNNVADSQYINLQEIKARCPFVKDKSACYTYYNTIGLNYGKSFQTIDSIQYSDNELLSSVELHESMQNSFSHYHYHPSLLDGALQSLVGFHKNEDLYLPYSIGKVELIDQLETNCFVYAQELNIQTPDERLFDIAISNSAGKIVLKINHLQLKLRAKVSPQKSTDTPLCYFIPQWTSAPITHPFKETIQGNLAVFIKDESYRKEAESSLNNKAVRLIFVSHSNSFEKKDKAHYHINFEKYDDYISLFNDLNTNQLFPNNIIHFCSFNAFTLNTISAQEELAYSANSIFNLSKTLITLNSKEDVNLLYLYQGENPFYSGTSGLIKSVVKETKRIKIKSLCFPQSESFFSNGISDCLNNEFLSMNKPVEIVKYNDELERFVQALTEVENRNDLSPEFKHEGTFLITGGTGGLGYLFATYFAKKYKAKLILTGRKKENAAIREKINALSRYSEQVDYFSVDVSNEAAMLSFSNTLKNKYNSINGIVHSAGIIRDSRLVNKSLTEFNEVIAPKVRGCILLDKITSEYKPDFFVLFSSLSGAIGNIGQTDYAYGNAFMDNFIFWREQQTKQGKRFGRSISINWPLWRNGGMQVDDEFEKFIRSSMGMIPLETDEGISIFLKSLSFNYNQFVVAKGNKTKIEKTLLVPNDDVEIKNEEVNEITDNTSVKNEKIQNCISGFICDILKVKKSNIDVYTDLSEYGFESITFTELANRINDKLTISITPTAFFEYPSIEEISTHILEEFPAVLKSEDVSTETSDTKTIRKISTPDQQKAIPLNLKFSDKVLIDTHHPISDDIAIVGYECVMPQSNNKWEFWEHLVKSNNLITKIPEERWDWRNVYGDPAKENNKTNVIWGGFMPDMDKFDNAFFGISPREAELMDPQQRLFIQIVWKTIEDAGYKVSNLAGTNTGVFVGVASNSYVELLRASGVDIEAYTSTGNSHSIIPNRISYLFDFHGPSEPIDTACSSSLIALHRGVEAIKNGKCDLAIAGGVNILIDPMLYISFDKAGMLSKDGTCKTFDANANGYVRGEGVGAVLLKPLKKALEDGDTIHAVVKSTNENHGGHANSLTAPNPKAQADLLVAAYKSAGIDPSTVTYIEAHGTGTSLGDPIEISGLKKAFNILTGSTNDASATATCGLGSVKSNIGHLETAAGIAGLIKTILAFNKGIKPATINFESLNPYIDLSNSPFYICEKAHPWERMRDANKMSVPRRAGVSSFGFGGANAHVVLEEYPDAAFNRENNVIAPQVILLSAKGGEELRQYAIDLNEFLQKNTIDTEENLNKGDDIQEIISQIKTVVSRSLYLTMDELDSEESWENLGMDIVSYSTLSKELGQQYSVPFINDTFLDYPSIELLAGFIHETISNSNQVANSPVPINYSVQLLDLAYTLQVGREDMEHRVVFIVSTIDELVQMLDDFVRDSDALKKNFFSGSIKNKKEVSQLKVDEEEDYKYLISLFEAGKLDKIAKLWISGFEIDWQCLYTRLKPRRISVPGYPFRKNGFWAPKPDTTSYITGNSTQALHPLVHTNDSDLYSQKFISDFTGEEFFFRDHVVNDQRVFPGAAYLEMICIAAEKVSRGKIKTVNTITWGSPMVIKDKPVQVQISIFPLSDSSIEFEIVTKTSESEQQHSYGKLQFTGEYDDDFDATDEYRVNSEGVRKKCTNSYEQNDIYTFFESIGLNYGTSFQVLKQINSNKKEAIAELELPYSSGHDFSKYILHPGIIDGGLQTVSGILRSQGNEKLYLPYSASDIEIYAPLESNCLVYAAELDEIGSKEKRFALKVINEKDETLLTIGEFVLRPLAVLPNVEAKKVVKSTVTNNSETHKRNDRAKALLLKDIDRIICNLLKTASDTLDYDTDLGELGFDSILFTELTNKLNETYKLEFTPAVFFEYSTINDLADHIVREHKANILSTLQMSEEAVDDSVELNVSNGSIAAFNKKHTGMLDRKYSKINTHHTNEPVAIIGLSGKMPLSDDINEFWNNICSEKDLISEIPAKRWNWKDFSGDPLKEPNKTNVKWGGFMRDIECFDNQFFSISHREAELMDPQQRLFLETVWHCIEDSGYKASDLSGSKTGLFVGVSTTDYSRILRDSGVEIQAYTTTGMSQSILANRISYLLNFHGPSEAIDTACSSSIVALNRAIESIHSETSEMAIVGGVNVIIDPMIYISFSKAGMLSKDGRCKTFDKDANGYVRGEGAGAIVLKPLSKAIVDGDNIYALIKSVAENHGGHSNSLTAPNVKAQANLLVDAYTKAGFDPSSISYIEAHGTGTSLGDPIEINALKNAFDSLFDQNKIKFNGKAYCGLGSVKTNIGHLEAAAGIAGLLKLILSLKHKTIPASINFNQLNPYIELKDSPFYITTKTKTWECHIDKNGKELPRRAGISSFGFGGANAHAVLEEFRETNSDLNTKNEVPQLFILSAKTPELLSHYIDKFIAFLKDTGKSLKSICYTLQLGREAMDERVAIVAESVNELYSELENLQKGENTGEHVFKGNTKENKKNTHLLLEGEEGEQYLKQLVTNNKLERIANLWVTGHEINWKWLHQTPAKRISLPAYPFSNTPHWIPENPERKAGFGQLVSNGNHTIISKNESTFQHYKYGAQILPTDDFVSDHLVKNKCVLPGVVYLEIMRAAVQLASGEAISAIRNIRWEQACVVNKPENLSVFLNPYEDEISCEIVSTTGEYENLHCSGDIITNLTPESNTKNSYKRQINIEEHLEELKNTIPKDKVYTIFNELGIQYGNSFRTIEQLYYSKNKAIALLHAKQKHTFKLNYGILDGALQAILGTTIESENNILRIPYAIEEVLVYADIPEQCYAMIERLAEPDEKSNELFSIDIADSDGNVCIHLDKVILKPVSAIYTESNSEESAHKNELLNALQNLEKGILNSDEVSEMIHNL